SRFANDKLAETEDEDEVLGTPQYICPEQLIGMPMDVRGDLYSLGATLYHAVTGVFPFDGDSASEIAHKHLKEELVPASVHNPDIPVSVCKLIDKMMAKHPDDRHKTVPALVKEIKQILGRLSTSKKTAKAGDHTLKIRTTNSTRAAGLISSGPISRRTVTGGIVRNTSLDDSVKPAIVASPLRRFSKSKYHSELNKFVLIASVVTLVVFVVTAILILKE
ncbi:MAG: hypothetical protein HRT88_16200, partial [Lentisphaeraceae bacterium]|nr:hypothetical protein [Lentisphaeraceae bacterium]